MVVAWHQDRLAECLSVLRLTLTSTKRCSYIEAYPYQLLLYRGQGMQPSLNHASHLRLLLTASVAIRNYYHV
jgi:hypothetical protein